MAKITPLQESPVRQQAAQATARAASDDKRCRGRPQVRPDDETRQIIYEAARHEFADSGYAATSMETVARRAGVSTKTLYRLVPNKASRFEGMVSDRLDRFFQRQLEGRRSRRHRTGALCRADGLRGSHAR